MKQVFIFLWQAIKNYRIYYFLMIIAPICGAFYKPIVYYSIKLMVDIIVSAKNLTLGDLFTPLAIYLVADIFLSTVWRLSQIALWKSEPYVQKDIILSAMHKVLSYRYVFFQNTASGSLVSKIKGLLDGYTELWAQLYYGILFWLLASIVAGISILFVSFKLGGFILSWSAIYVFINYFLAQKINALSEIQNNSTHMIMGDVADIIGNVHSVKLFATRAHEEKRLGNKIADQFVTSKIKLHKFHFKVDVLNDILAIATVLIMLLMMIELKKSNQISVGDFVFVFGMVFQFQESLWHLMQEFHKLSDRMGDLKSSLSINDADINEYSFPDPAIDNTCFLLQNYNSSLITNSGNISVNIEFKNIYFKYSKSKQVFNNLNLQIKPKEKIGIVGYTGSGKTTLINLLLKIFTPDEGQILINNQDIATLDNDYLRSLISVIPQDINLFHRDLFTNISYGKPDASRDEVIRASQKADAHEFICKLPLGYDTLVGERGLKLSGGQRQRIAIARAMLKNAPILILDEATSSLDSVTEKYINENIQKLLEDKTVLAIAHRLSTLKSMDKLVVINQGKIIEIGTHDQLLKKENSLYAKIWHTQYSE